MPFDFFKYDYISINNFDGALHYPFVFDFKGINALLGAHTVDVLLSGVSPLTLLNAVSLNYVKAFGKCEQASTPTPANPVDILCNNGTIKVKDDELPLGYKRLLDISTSGNVRYISNVYLTGEDTLKFRFKAAAGNLIGAYNDPDANDNFSFYNSTNATGSYARYNGQTGGSATYSSITYTVIISPTGITGIRNPSSFTPTEFTCSIPLCVFATAPTGSVHSNATIYGSIEVTGSQNLNLVPCERVSDGAIGYYNTSNSMFLENQESGTPTTSGYDTSHLTEVYIDGTDESVVVEHNYFTDEGMTTGYIIDFATGAITENANYNISVPIRLTAGDYRVSYYTPSTGSRPFVIWECDAQGNIIGSEKIFGIQRPVSGTNTGTFTIDREMFVLICWRLDFTNIVVATAISSATCQPLLSVGDYKDVQNITNGAVTRNVGIMVFNGTEDWQAHTVVGTYRYRLEGKLLEKSLFYSTHFVYSSATSTGLTDGEMMCGAASPNIYVCKTDMTTLDSFKAWLASQQAAGTPVVVVYPLATPTTETVTGQTLSITQGTNIVTATGAVSDLELEISYKAYAEITVEEIEAVNTDENVEVIIS